MMKYMSCTEGISIILSEHDFQLKLYEFSFAEEYLLFNHNQNITFINKIHLLPISTHKIIQFTLSLS